MSFLFVAAAHSSTACTSADCCETLLVLLSDRSISDLFGLICGGLQTGNFEPFVDHNQNVLDTTIVITAVSLIDREILNC